MRILNLIRKTAGGRHGVYATDKGFNVRKPLQEIAPDSSAIGAPPSFKDHAGTLEPMTLWERIREWFRLVILKFKPQK